MKKIGPDRQTPFYIMGTRPGALHIAVLEDDVLVDQGWVSVSDMNLAGRTVSYYDWEKLIGKR